jgi:glycosyltransferase involved in cell wall biosynthesis
MVLKLGNINVIFIPNGLTYLPNINDLQQPMPEQIAQFLNKHDPCIAFVGAMEPIYGLDVLLKAIPELLPIFPNLGVIIIAYKHTDKEYRAKIINLLDDLHLNESVVIPASLPNVPLVVKEVDAFVRSTLADGDSIAVREALALGVPAIVSNVGYRPEGAVLFRSGDHLQLATKISEVLGSPRGDRKIQSDGGENTIIEYLRAYSIAESIRQGKIVQQTINS